MDHVVGHGGNDALETGLGRLNQSFAKQMLVDATRLNKLPLVRPERGCEESGLAKQSACTTIEIDAGLEFLGRQPLECIDGPAVTLEIVTLSTAPAGGKGSP